MPGMCGARLWVEREDGLVPVLVRPREDDAAWAAADAPDVWASTYDWWRTWMRSWAEQHNLAEASRVSSRVRVAVCMMFAALVCSAMPDIFLRGGGIRNGFFCRSPLSPFSPPSALPSPSQPFPHLWIFIFESVLTPLQNACANRCTSSSPSSTAGGSSARCQ
ncbi:hypothetical protein B0H13DRAFT_2393344, partial [Mycena leptocephala]